MQDIEHVALKIHGAKESLRFAAKHRARHHLLPPNGAKIHDRNTCWGHLIGFVELLKRSNLEVTFGELAKANSEFHGLIVEEVMEAVRLGVKI